MGILCDELPWSAAKQRLHQPSAIYTVGLKSEI